MNSGLYALAGDSATAMAAACANRLEGPITKVSNRYLGLSRLPPDCTTQRSPRPGPLSLGSTRPRLGPIRPRSGRPRSRAGGIGAGPVAPADSGEANPGSAGGTPTCGYSLETCGYSPEGYSWPVWYWPPGSPPAWSPPSWNPPSWNLPAPGRPLSGRALGACGPGAGQRRWPSVSPGSGREAGGAGARPVATHPASPGPAGPGEAGRSGGLSVTATWMGRPSLRESASVIAGRSFISIWSRVNASGTDNSAVSSTIARSLVARRYARCWAETISSAISSVVSRHTAARSPAPVAPVDASVTSSTPCPSSPLPDQAAGWLA